MHGPLESCWSDIGRTLLESDIDFAGIQGCRCIFVVVNSNLPPFRDSANDPSPNSDFQNKHRVAVLVHGRIKHREEGGVRPDSGGDALSAGQHSNRSGTPPSAPPTYEEAEGDAE